MAIQWVKQVGTAASSGAASDIAVSIPGAGVARGNALVLHVSYDNTNTGYVPAVSSVIDSQGNPWVLASGSGGTSASGSGITNAIYISPVIKPLVSGNVITVTLAASVTARVVQVHEFSGVNTMRLWVNTPQARSGTGPFAGTTTGKTLAAGDLVMGFLALEHASATMTADSDTTNGSWSTAYSAVSHGTTTSATRSYLQYKIVTAAGDQSWAPSSGTVTNVEFITTVIVLSPMEPVEEVSFKIRSGGAWVSASDVKIRSGGAWASAKNPTVKRPLIIKHGWDVANEQNLPFFWNGPNAYMKDRPVDGWAINIDCNVSGTASTKLMANAALPYTTLRATLATDAVPLNLNKGPTRHNFALARCWRRMDATVAATDNSRPWWDTAYWDTVADNFRNFAMACREAGFKGIMLDTEMYNGAGEGPAGDTWKLWSYDSPKSGHTLQQTRDAAQAAGKKVMDAVLSVWPECVLITLYGAWVSDQTVANGGAGSAGTGTGINNPTALLNNVTDVTEGGNLIQGSFMMGILESIVNDSNQKAKYVDGGEIYNIRSATQAQTAYNWLKTGLAAASATNHIIPSALRANYAQNVSVGFGVWDNFDSNAAWPNFPSTSIKDPDPPYWDDRLALALDYADEYVWIYTERYNWSGIGGATVPAQNITDTTAARKWVKG
jgi:hypothetical protein